MPEIGQTISHYRIIEKLGQGGMGEVFLAHDASLDRKVALKFLPDIFSGDPERLARFEREAKLLASLNHPNIAAIYGLEQADGKRFLVMELVEGETLAQKIAEGPLPVEEALEDCRQIAEGVEAAHEKGVIHRDLKPANVKITPDGKVKVLDFGLAKVFQEEASASDASHSPTLTDQMTRPGVILGTAAYMAPEQAKGKSVDKRADIWAFGCILYETLAGKRPFDGETVTETLASILKGEPDWAAMPASVSPRVHELVRSCLGKNLKDRLHDIGDARMEIDRALKEPTGRQTNAARFSWKQSSLVAAACLIIGAAGAVLLLNVYQPSAPFAMTRSQISVAPATRLGADWREGAADTNNLAKNEEERGLKRPSRTAIALSPDGRILVFGGVGDKGSMLYKRSLDSWDAAPIAGTEGGRDPFFSPDGQWVGFWANNQWKKVNLNGGLPQDICPAPSIHWGICWGDGDLIVYSSSKTLWKVSAAGGKPEPLITVSLEKEEQRFVLPHILPGARSMLFCTVTSRNRWANPRIESLTFKTLERNVVLAEGADARYTPTGHLLFSRQGDLYAVAFDPKRLATEGAASRIVPSIMQAINARGADLNSYAAQYVFSAGGTLAYVPGGAYPDPQRVLAEVDQKGVPRRLTAEVKSYYFPRIGPDGRHLLYWTQEKQANVFIYDMDHDTHRRVTPGNSEFLWPIWAPDGKRVAFADRSERNIFWTTIDAGEKLEPLYESQDLAMPSSFSPDGSLLAFVKYKGEESLNDSDIYILKTQERQAEAFLTSPCEEMHPTFSPDGHFLAYTSNETKRLEVYVSKYPRSGPATQITKDGGWGPLWSPNGRRIYFASLDRQKLWAVDIELQPEIRAGKLELVFDHKGAYLMPGIPARDFDITSDGQHFIFSQSVEPEPAGATQINIVTNWFEELKRLVPTGKK